MKYIKRLIIKKFNGMEKTLDIEFNKGINVFVGMHGCGKTLVIKTITALINENLVALKSYSVGDIKLIFENGETIVYDTYTNTIRKSSDILLKPAFENGVADTKENFKNIFAHSNEKLKETKNQINKIINPDFEFKTNKIETKDDENFIEIAYYKGSQKQVSYFDEKNTYVAAYEKIGNFIMKSQMNDFLLLDEPEQGLCIEWQKELLPTLNENVNQVICMTHSPFIFKLEDNWNVSELEKYLIDATEKK